MDPYWQLCKDTLKGKMERNLPPATRDGLGDVPEATTVTSPQGCHGDVPTRTWADTSVPVAARGGQWCPWYQCTWIHHGFAPGEDPPWLLCPQRDPGWEHLPSWRQRVTTALLAVTKSSQAGCQPPGELRPGAHLSTLIIFSNKFPSAQLTAERCGEQQKGKPTSSGLRRALMHDGASGQAHTKSRPTGLGRIAAFDFVLQLHLSLSNSKDLAVSR